MKFGRILAARQMEDWRYISYDTLKRQIKESGNRLTSTQAFHTALRADIAEVDAFFCLCLQRAQTNDSSPGEDGGSRTIPRCVSAAEIRSYAILNYLAVLKILKKHDRMLSRATPKPEEREREDIQALSAATRRQFFEAKFCKAMSDPGFFSASPHEYAAAQAVDIDHAAASSSSVTAAAHCGTNYEDACPICLESIIDAVCLPCHHRFCWACLASCATSGINSCPLCRKEQTLEPVNLEIETILGCLAQRYYPGNQQEVSWTMPQIAHDLVQSDSRPSSPCSDDISLPDSQTMKADSPQGPLSPRTPPPAARCRLAASVTPPRTPRRNKERLSFTPPPPPQFIPFPPLLKAIRQNCQNSVQLALQEDPEAAKFPFFDHSVEPPLCAAIRYHCSNQVIQILLDNGADVNLTDIYGKTPLALLYSNECTAQWVPRREPEQYKQIEATLVMAGARAPTGQGANNHEGFAPPGTMFDAFYLE
eukprot:CAMPEP_0178391222 /NCGR_PEP_ID=MMETSP0689_2-20121128/11054_1 /TAXON_ID=160604 /ORGANISM="Amphidinium massartii, Strain CS-259" /LENGTH=478 /DNA_ID=CAMNT_0020011763 /DNA_START=80 /DNA_END=1516 /DNA_ORIENTATION=-